MENIENEVERFLKENPNIQPKNKGKLNLHIDTIKYMLDKNLPQTVIKKFLEEKKDVKVTLSNLNIFIKKNIQKTEKKVVKKTERGQIKTFKEDEKITKKEVVKTKIKDEKKLTPEELAKKFEELSPAFQFQKKQNEQQL